MKKQNLKPLKLLIKFPSCKLNHNFKTCDIWERRKSGCSKCVNFISKNYNFENS